MRLITLLVSQLVLLLSCTSQQKTAGGEQLSVLQMVDSQHYQFTAQQMQPQSGRSRVVNGTYFLQVTKDAIVSDLPYAGRAYAAPIGSTDSGLRFTSKDFEYSVSPGKNDSREVIIRPKDGGDTREMFLTIFPNGTASLRVTSNNRQPISFTGDIEKIPPKK